MTLKNKTHVYFMPGMCANPLIFERIKLSSNFKPHYLNWISPLKNESLQNYVIRLSKYIKHKDSILVGVSFGGVIVQELSKILKIKKVVIISSIKSNKELSNSMKFAKKTKSYKLLPVTWLNDFESLLAFVLGPKIKRKVNLYRKYLSVRDQKYLDWSIDKIVNWDQEEPIKNVVHIHGTNDLIFPIINLKNYIVEIKKRYYTISQNQTKLLST